MKQKFNKSSIQKHDCIKLIKSFGILKLCTYAETEEYHETLTAHHLPKFLKRIKIWQFQSSTLLIENYSQNQCQYSLNTI